jgi:ArsR family transcriptional regulator
LVSFEEAAEVIKVLGHPARLQIIELLEGRERTVKEITGLLKIPQSKVSQHLTLLRNRGILSARREGINMYYSIHHPHVTKIIHCIKNR